MAGTNNGAGRLTERVAFDQRGSASDGAGGTSTAFVEQFRRWASFTHLRGGEAVQAARLGGRHTQVIRVRRDSQTVLISTDWQVRDLRSLAVYAVLDVEHETNRAFISLTCQSGVAS